MALVDVNLANKWLSSVDTDDFKHAIDIDRYKTFATDMIDGAITVGKEILDNIWNTLSKAFSGISSFNKGEIMDMITDALSSILGIGGSLLDSLGIKNSMETVCGGFDSGMFNKYGGDFGSINALGLMGLSSSLLCMGVPNVLSNIKGIAKGIGLGPDSLLSVVSNTMDSLNIGPISNFGLGNNSFLPNVREFIDTKFDVGGILGDIVGDNELLSVFKDTSVGTRLVTSYVGDNLESYADALLPNWKVPDLATTTNATKSLAFAAKSSPVPSISSITDVSKKDFMFLI